MSINKRLKMLRERSGMTLEDVSKIVKVSKQTIQKYESGVVQSIPTDKIELLAKAYDVSPGFIMGWHEIQSDDTSAWDDYSVNGAHMAYRERLRREPGTRMLLDVTEDATPEEMQQYVDVIKALRKQYDDE